MTDSTPATAARLVPAKNRWHALWVIIRESFRHPLTDKIIVWKPREPARHRGSSKTKHYVLDMLTSGGVASFTWPIGRHRAR